MIRRQAENQCPENRNEGRFPESANLGWCGRWIPPNRCAGIPYIAAATAGMQVGFRQRPDARSRRKPAVSPRCSRPYGPPARPAPALHCRRTTTTTFLIGDYFTDSCRSKPSRSTNPSSTTCASKEAATIVRSTIDLAHDLGRKTVAEGVETQVYWDRLSALGCDFGQGYFIAKPMQATDFQAWLRQFVPPLTGRSSS